LITTTGALSAIIDTSALGKKINEMGQEKDDGRRAGWMEGRMDGWMKGWMDGRMDGWKGIG